MHISMKTGIAIGAGVLCLNSVALAEPYPTGFVWQRVNDYDGGSIDGTNWLRGNPDDDDSDNSVWSYEHVSSNGSDGLNSTAVGHWYRKAPTLMVWDSDVNGVGVFANWVAADDTNPQVLDVSMLHVWLASPADDWSRVPVVRWKNPAGDGAVVEVGGDYVLSWAGTGNTETVDVVIAHHNLSSGGWSIVYSATHSHPGSTSLSATVPATTVNLDSGDELIISVKARVSGGSTNARWVTLRDENVTYTLVGRGGCYCPADLNGDGIVNFADQNLLLNQFGLTCAEIEGKN